MTCRYFSILQMTCADNAALFSIRSNFTIFRSTSWRSGGVISTWCPVSSSRMVDALRKRRSVQQLALVGRRDLQLFAVFRDRAPRQDQSFLLQDADDLGIAQRFARIFVLDDLSDALLDGDRRNTFPVRAAEAAV